MRKINEVLFVIDGGVTPKAQLKNILESGCTENGYSYEEISVDSSGDASLYFRFIKSE